jgi:hypothetical protein
MMGQPGRSGAGGSVAFGIALLFLIGAFGFYRLTMMVPPGHSTPKARPGVHAVEEVEPEEPATPPGQGAGEAVPEAKAPDDAPDPAAPMVP